jgi:lipoate-protein ligase A
VGKHQNTIEEVNKAYVDEHQIVVSRRLSGGGAVYHDEGNLNFSFVLQAGKEDVNNFRKFTQPIILALDRIGVKAELSGRNDITIDGKKFSGNAQFAKRNRLLHHGTLLFDSQMANLANALQVKDLKIQSKGVKSVRSRVTNIKPYLTKDISIEEFRQHLLEFMGELNPLEEIPLSQQDLAEIEQRVATKFSTWEWNWGSSPDFDIQKMDKFECGIIDARLNISEGRVKDVKLFGDFFVRQPIEELESALRNQVYRREDMKLALQHVDLNDYFFNLDKDVFVDFLCEQ